MSPRLRSSFVALVLVLAMVVPRAHAAVVIEVDGSLDSMLALGALLESPGSSSIYSVKLVVVSAPVQTASSAYVNVKRFLKYSKFSDETLPVVLGSVSSLRDQVSAATGTGGCRDVAPFPNTEFDSVHPHPPTLSAPWSLFDEADLFGAAATLRQGADPPVPRSQQTSAADAIQRALETVINAGARYERLDYIALSTLTTMSTFLNSSTVTASMLSRLNLHIVASANDANLLADADAANLVFAAPLTYRTLYTSSMTSAVATFGNYWRQLMALRQEQPAPPGPIVWLLDALVQKSQVVERLATERQTPVRFTEGNFGPRLVLGALAAVRSGVKAELVMDDAIALISISNGALNVTVLQDTHHTLDATHVYRQAYPSPSTFWSDLLVLLQSKQWMG